MYIRATTWWTILRISIEERLVYRGDFVLGTLMRFLPIVTQIFLWLAVFEAVETARGETTVGRYTYHNMIAYYLLTMVSRAFSSMEEAFATVLDQTEGAGLGIVILILMLKKIGLDEEAFAIDVEDGETVATLTIPFNDVQVEKMDALTKQIIREVGELPQFPDNILHLQRLIC